MLRAGLLREVVEVQRASVSRDAFGAGVLAWSTVSTLRAALKPAGGNEGGQQDTMKGRARWEMTLRAGTSIGTKDRILWRGVAYEVERPPQVDPMREFQTVAIVESVDPRPDTGGEPESLPEFVE